MIECYKYQNQTLGEETVSISAINKTDIKFYPNPVVNELTITRTSTDLTYLQVMSTMGTIVVEKAWDKGSTMIIIKVLLEKL